MLTLALALLGAPGVAHASTPPSPDSPPAAGLLADLALVPDTESARQNEVSWVDFRAVEAARPGAVRPASVAEWRSHGGDPGIRIWSAAFNGIRSGPDAILRSAPRGDEWPRTVGFDLFDIDRALRFGEPLGLGAVLRGTFDPTTIGAALASRGFTDTPSGEATLWCAAAGCDAGTKPVLSEIDPGDPFGGDLGRKQPLGVTAEVLFSSPSLPVVEGMLAAGSGEQASLADDPGYVAVANALGGDGTLLQATILPMPAPAIPATAVSIAVPTTVTPTMMSTPVMSTPVMSTPVMSTPAMSTPAMSTGAMSTPAMTTPAMTTPPTSTPVLLGIGDSATSTEQVVRVALTFGSIEDAQSAAGAWAGVIDEAISARTKRTVRELLDDRGVTSSEATTYADPNGTAVAVLTLRAPLATATPDDDGVIRASSQVYSLIVQMMFTQDLAWLEPIAAQ